MFHCIVSYGILNKLKIKLNVLNYEQANKKLNILNAEYYKQRYVIKTQQKLSNEKQNELSSIYDN